MKGSRKKSFLRLIRSWNQVDEEPLAEEFVQLGAPPAGARPQPADLLSRDVPGCRTCSVLRSGWLPPKKLLDSLEPFTLEDAPDDEGLAAVSRHGRRRVQT